MPDVSVMMHAIQTGSLWAFPLLFVAGLLSSAGPCAVPRMLALAALALHSRRPALVAASFLAGSFSVLGLFGLAASSILDRLNSAGHLLYLTAAIAGLAGGIATVARAEWHACPGDTTHRRDKGTLGIAYATGAGLSLMISPCCTPVLALVVAASAVSADPIRLALMLLTFGVGHAGIAILACGSARPLLLAVAGSRLGQAAQIAGGTLMIVLGSYYALLA